MKNDMAAAAAAANGQGAAAAFFPPTMNFWNPAAAAAAAAAYMPPPPPSGQNPMSSMTPITSPLPFGPPASSAAASLYYQQAAMSMLANPHQLAAMMAQLQAAVPPMPLAGQHSSSSSALAALAQQQLVQQQQQQQQHSQPPTPSGGGHPLLSPPLSGRSAQQSPTFPSSCTTPSPPAGALPNEMRAGIGVLTWLSSKAGLIRCQQGDMGTVSFQLKDFCDQAIADLTAVLRPGFTLKFQALSSGQRDWIATFVAPVHGQSANQQFLDSTEEVNLEAPPGTETGPPQMPRDPYSMELELRAVPMLLQIFERQGLPQCQLSSFHCQISNCGDDELYRYVGTSSLKRRQFLERRTHLFHISATDQVSLQPAEMYATVLVLAKRLLCRGGACLMQELFDHFNSCPDIPLEARELIGDGKTNFLRFLESHPWIFAVFPSRVFVSIRRNLPPFEYAAFLNEHFSDCDLRQYSPLNASRSSGASVRAAFPKSSLPAQASAAVASARAAASSSTGLVDTGAWPPLPSQQPPLQQQHDGVSREQLQQGGSSKYSPPTSLFDAYSNGVPQSQPPSILTNGYHHHHHQQQQQQLPPSMQRQPSTPGWGAPTPIDELPPQHQRAISVQSQQPVTTGFWGRGSMGPPQNSSGAGDGRAGGRIKRFVDIEVQTDAWRPATPAVVAAQRPQTVERGCGPDDETVGECEPSQRGFISADAAAINDKPTPEPPTTTTTVIGGGRQRSSSPQTPGAGLFHHLQEQQSDLGGGFNPFKPAIFGFDFSSQLGDLHMSGNGGAGFK